MKFQVSRDRKALAESKEPCDKETKRFFSALVSNRLELLNTSVMRLAQERQSQDLRLPMRPGVTEFCHAFNIPKP